MRREGKYLLGTVEEVVKEIVDMCCFEWRKLKFPNFDFLLLDSIEDEELEEINKNGLEYSMQHTTGYYYGVKFVNTGFDSEEITLVADKYGGSCMACASLWDREYAEDELIKLIKDVADNDDGYNVKRDDYLLVMYI